MQSEQLKRELAAIGLMLAAVFVAGVLLMHGAGALVAGVDVRWGFGAIGSRVAGPIVYLVGWPGAALVPLIPALYALRLFGRLDARTDRSALVLAGGLALLLPIAVALLLGAQIERTDAAGLWGHMAGYYMRRGFGVWGAWIVLLAAGSALTATTMSWNPVRQVLNWRLRLRTARAAGTGGGDGDDGRGSRRVRSGTGAPSLTDMLQPAPEEVPLAAATPAQGATLAEKLTGRSRRKRGKNGSVADRDAQIVAQMEASAAPPATSDDELPEIALLSLYEKRSVEEQERELDVMGAKLMEALRTFRVDGELVGRTTGPVVTQFEVEPAPGVKVRQFANLANDLALAMRAQSIRIVAPIPGRGAVGIEVPNPFPEIVHFRELLESREFQTSRGVLPIALGRDLEGRPVIADLARMPHLLIAGATGSGKSVCINTLITSLVYRHTPRTLRFLLVDPKMVELSLYNTLPHMRHKVVTDNRDAASVLKWAVLEMQERYEILAANGCRNVQEFNKRLREGVPMLTPRNREVAFEDRTYHGGELPYIVLIIDELADLMMTVQGEVERPLALLAQKARAIGIHLILATQRPSVNVITGLIKANFPSRIAFRVASQVDSRTILDGVGAESLLGNGDMLFIPPGKSEPARLQGAYISSEDSERLVRWYEERALARRAALAAMGVEPAEPAGEEDDILETIRRLEAAEAAGSEEDDQYGDRDRLFREAAEVVIQHRQGSTSLLQRRLKVGYGRAARIIDQLHQAGVLGPPEGSRPREVLIGLDEVDRVCRPGSGSQDLV